MNLWTKAGLLLHIARWRINWDKHDSHYRPEGLENPKFMSARQAVGLIRDGDCCFSSGMAANARCSIFFWAIKEAFLETGHPRDLTWITVGAQGSRGRVPGTMEEIGIEGIIRRWIGGHLETFKAQLRLAQEGKLEVHRFPQGLQTFLMEAQARGEESIVSETGVGTTLDPRVDRGSPVVKGVGESLITVEGDKLRYRLPKVNVALFVASYADEEGNIYFKNMSTFTEAYETAMAAKANGGRVLVAVADLIPRDEKNIRVRADKVDAIVVNPGNEQTGSIPQRRYWEMFVEGARVDVDEAVGKLRFANRILKITPVRTEVDNALARMAANLFTRITRPGATVNIGVGLPEEVCRLIYEGGLLKEVTFLVETGAVGGLPAMGIFFGAAINPKQLMSSAQVFHLCQEKLEVTVLGLLQADSEGNINVSKRGEGPINYVGGGGLPDLVAAARKMIFIGSWMANARMAIEGGKLKILKPGTCKFIERVDEITCSGQQALKLGKDPYYCTNVGIFHLTQRGMELIEVMPGVDIRKDILEVCPMKVVLPESGEVRTVSEDIVTGRGFELRWRG
jgi:propionate CoA-transferase